MNYSLDKEIQTYERCHDDLVRSALGKYALVHGESLVGVFETQSDALRHGYRTFGHVPLFVKKVVRFETPGVFGSALLGR